MKTLNQIQQMSNLMAASSGKFFDFLFRGLLSNKIIGPDRAFAALPENREITSDKVVQEKAGKQYKTIEDEIIAQMAEEHPSIFLT